MARKKADPKPEQGPEKVEAQDQSEVEASSDDSAVEPVISEAPVHDHNHHLAKHPKFSKFNSHGGK